MKGVFHVDKEKLNSKLKDMKKQAGANAQKTKENLGKVFDKENVKENINKAKKSVEKAVDVTMNSNIVKKMNPNQKLMALGVSVLIVIVIIALIGRFVLSPKASIWCVATAPKIELSFNSAGEVVEVAFQAKQVASKGATIARLKDEDLIAEFESVSSKFSDANMKYLNMENRLVEMENTLAEIKLNAAESASAAATAAFGLATAYEVQYRSYYEKRMISEAQYQSSIREKANAEAIMSKAEKDLEEAKQYLETAKQGHTPEEIAIAKEEATTLEAQVATAQAALEGALIVAPFDAYINSINIIAGAVIEPEKPVCEVVDMSNLWLRGLVDKSTADSVKPGAVINKIGRAHV